MAAREPDIVLACAGDVPTIEACATSWLLQKHVPGIKVRVVNVVDLNVADEPGRSSARHGQYFVRGAVHARCATWSSRSTAIAG